MMQYFPLLLIFTGSIIITVGDIIIKKWVETDKTLLFWVGIIVYMIGSLFLAYSFKYKNIAVASVMYVVLNVITLSIVSWFYFHEKLTPVQIVGLLIGLSAVIILELE